MYEDFSLGIINNLDLSDTDSTTDEGEKMITNLTNFPKKRISKRKTKLDDIGDWVIKYDDDIWYLWGLIQDYIKNANLGILDKMDYSNFVIMCYDNSSRYY